MRERFESWAIVELKDGKLVGGHVVAKIFGSSCMFSVFAPKVNEEQRKLTSAGSVNGKWLSEGSIITVSKSRFVKMIEPAAIKCITKCTKTEALEANPPVYRIVGRVER